MQWDCSGLARQDKTKLLPKNGVLYLFADLTWNDQHAFQFIHAKGPTHNWTPLPVPQIPLLPKWPFTPLALPHSGAQFWADDSATAERLLALEYPDGPPPPKRLDSERTPFSRPFPTFPNDYSAVRIVTAAVLRTARRAEAVHHHEAAAAHPPQTRVDPTVSDTLWNCMQSMESVLAPGWAVSSTNASTPASDCKASP